MVVFCSVEITPDGKTATLTEVEKPKCVTGNGLYLKRGSNYINGEGLLLGPNSPFKKFLF